MRRPLIRRVDPWRLAGRGEVLEGVLAPERLGRLSAVAEPPDGLDVDVSFEPSGGNGSAVKVRLAVRGRVRTACQRCLEPMDLWLQLDGVVVVAHGEVAARAEEGDWEALVLNADEFLDLDDLVQEEVMLALPFAPRHEGDDCAVPGSGRGDTRTTEHGANIEPAGEDRPGDSPGRKRTNNPFAVLSSLRGDDREAH